MNNRKLLFSLGVCIIVGGAFFCTSFLKETAKYTPREINNYFKAHGANGAAEWIYNIKKNQITGTIDNKDVLQARQEAQLLSQNKSGKSLSNFSFREVGPDNIGGRARAIVIDKANPSIIYVGGVSGGIFKSVTGGSSWVKINDMAENLAVASMAQCPLTGYIYAGTGEGLGNGPMGITDGNTAFVGKGIYISKDGNTFSLLASTIPTASNTTATEFATINELAVDENGWIYAATNKGLRLSKDTGVTWTNPVIYPATSPYVAVATDVSVLKVGDNKTVVASVGNKVFISNTGDGGYINHSTQPISDTTNHQLPSSTVSRNEIAIAPSNPDYIYVCVAKNNGNLFNVYRTIDKGANWHIIGLGGTTTFEPLGGQGSYGNTIAVFPNNPDKIILGGIDIWSWELGGNWEQRTLWYLEETNPYYNHADIHKFVFSPNHPNTFYVGSDGGISKSIDGGKTFSTINKNFSVTQFYTVSCSRSGDVIGGTQDNGTILVNRQGNTVQDGVSVMGGDGGGAAISIINPEAYFATTYYAGTGRSPNKGVTFYPKDDGTSPFFSPRMLALGTPGQTFPAAFVTPMLLWESFNDIYSPDSVIFKAADTSYTAGEVVQVKSKNGYFFDYQLLQNLNDGQEIKVHDKIQSKFYLGIDNAVWMTREALDFSVQPKWFKIATLSGQTIAMTISKDGMYVFAATSSGNIYRISNMRLANDSISADVLSPYMVVETKLLGGGLPSGRTPTSIAVDPSNANNVIVTYGNYGNTNYIYWSINALDQNPTFVSKQGNLPKMPVYASIIEMNNSSLVIIGTEYGIYATENILAASPIWADVNTNGLANVPVYMLKQQIYDYPGVSNYGVIYAATHGRGIFESSTYEGINDNGNVKPTSKLEINVYPNPVTDRANITYNFKFNSKVYLKVYDIQGRLKASYELPNTQNNFSFDCTKYSKGTYIVQLINENKKASAKFIVY